MTVPQPVDEVTPKQRSPRLFEAVVAHGFQALHHQLVAVG